MDLELTPDSTYQLTWSSGQLCLNLLPLNQAAGDGNELGVDYATVQPPGVLANTIADMVGIVGLGLKNCPRVPRILWDNREHQFWDGFEGGFEPRNVVVNAPTVELADHDTVLRASFYYIANYVKTTVAWVIRESEFVDGSPVWDTVITIENLTGHNLQNYLHFFACYHPPAPNSYWAAAAEIKPCAVNGFVAVADPAQERRLRSSPYQQLGDRYRGDQKIEYFRYHRPVLLSQSRPWYGGARHVLMIEPAKCAAIVTWNHQARDYMIRPANHDLNPGETFTTRIRHAIAAVNNTSDLERLWSGFSQYLERGFR